MKFDIDGGLITYAEGDGTFCLGYLFEAPGQGIYDATLGKVDVTSEQAQAHNRVYDQCLVKDLENCKIGEGNNFYVGDEVYIHGGLVPYTEVVSTWLGTRIGEATRKVGTKATYLLYWRGNAYKYRKYPNDNTVYLTRIQ